jgi:hypothetical protein
LATVRLVATNATTVSLVDWPWSLMNGGDSIEISVRLILSKVLGGQKQHPPGLVREHFAGERPVNRMVQFTVAFAC